MVDENPHSGQVVFELHTSLCFHEKLEGIELIATCAPGANTKEKISSGGWYNGLRPNTVLGNEMVKQNEVVECNKSCTW